MPEGTAVIVATSGSTGAPKGAELSAAALLHSARASLARIGARPGERWLCCLPAAHIAGIQVLVRSLVSGTDPVLADRADAHTVAASGCAHVSLVPTQLHRLLGRPVGAMEGFRSVLLGGAAASAGLVDAAGAAGVPVVTTYGMTETCGGCVYDGIPLDGVRLGSATTTASGSAARCCSPVTGGGPGRPGRVVPDRRPGPDPSGRLVVRGRAVDVINTGGHKVVPGEVAAALQACPGVRDVAVLGLPDDEWGELVVAVVAPEDRAGRRPSNCSVCMCSSACRVTLLPAGS